MMKLPQAVASAFIRREENRFIYQLEADFPAFDGHFPGNALLPAVAQLAFALDAARRETGKNLTLVRVERAKFTSPVKPGASFTVTLETGENGFFKAAFSSTEGKIYGSAKFCAREVL